MRLEARTMGVLLCLAERPGTVVSIPELLDQVWSGVVVTPDSVYQAVASLRRVLGDDARRPCYIETVPRLGYRLVAAVSPWGAMPVETAAPAPALHDAAAAVTLTIKGQPPRTPRGVAAIIACGAAFSLVLFSAAGLRGDLASALHGLARTGAAPQSVAVLPLLDLSARRLDGEVPDDGMTEELIYKISRNRGIRVPPPTCPSYLKGKPLGDIARSLDVAYVLDGSVHRSETSVRVAVRLIRAHDGHVVWAETYDRPEANTVALQDDIASQVVKVLKASLT